jgi:hypothetical protein
MIYKRSSEVIVTGKNPGESGTVRTIQQTQNELLLKEIRAAYWEMNHCIPTLKEIDELKEVMI